MCAWMIGENSSLRVQDLSEVVPGGFSWLFGIYRLQYKYESLSFVFMKSDMPPNSSPVDAEVLSASAIATTNPPIAQRVLPSQQLFGRSNEVLIEHAGFTYRLRITQANKLILTK
jgi:hemin uptake protein HemP